MQTVLFIVHMVNTETHHSSLVQCDRNSNRRATTTTRACTHARTHTRIDACIHTYRHHSNIHAAILALVKLGGCLLLLPGGRALMAAEALAANVTWLTEFLAGDIDASRRSEAEALLKTASKLTKQPSKTVLRQIAKELQVHQKDRRTNEIYDAALARVGDRVDELRKQSQERRSKRPRSEAVAVSGFPSNISDAQQFAGDDRNMSSATTGQDQPEIASGIGVSRDSDVDQFAARSVLKRERPDQVNLPAVESDTTQLAARSGADEIAVARGGGGSSSSGARPAKREKLITVNSGSVSTSHAAQLADIADNELRSKRVPKSTMKRSSGFADGNKDKEVLQYSTIIGSIPPKPHMRRPYPTISSVHRKESAQTFIKAMYLLCLESEKIIQDIIPSLYKEQKKIITKNVAKKWRFGNLFTSSISNYNIPAPFHIDRANLQGCANVIIAKRKDSIGGNTSVPDYDITVDSKDNSLLVYPAWKNVHGVTPIIPTKENGYRNTLVFYPLKAFNGLD